MKLSITAKTSIAGLVILAMLLLVSFMSYQERDEEAKAGRWIVHTHEVLHALEKLHAAVADCDAALRGFVISRQDLFLRSYRAAALEIKEQEEQLITLVADNPSQVQRAKRLITLFDEKSRLSDQLADPRRTTDVAALKQVGAGVGERLTVPIKALVETMEAEEKHLLARRNDELVTASRNNSFGQSLLILSALCLLVVAYVLVIRHVKEADRSELSLRSSKLRFTGIFQQAFQFIWLLSTEGALLQANQTALDFIGMKRETEVGKPFWETAWWVHQTESREVLKHALQDASKGQLARLELETTAGDGKPIELDFSFKPLVDDDGEVILIIAEGRDISDFKAAQARLNENQVRLNAIFSSMGEGLYQLDNEGNLIYLNPAGARILGYENENIIGRNMHTLIHTDIPESSDHYTNDSCPILKVMREGATSQAVDDYFKKSDGSAIPIQYYSAPLISDGEIQGAVVSFADITARKEAQRRSATQYAMTSVLSQADSVAEAAPRILAQICEHNGWDAAIFWQVDEQSELLNIVDIWYDPALDLSEWEQSHRAKSLKRGDGLAGRVWASNAPLWIGKQAGEVSQQLILEASKRGLNSLFAFPVRSDETMLGVIELFATDAIEPTPDRLQMLNALGSQFGQFIERKNTEMRLKDREMLFQQLAESVEEIFWISSVKDNKLLYCSPAYERVWGRPLSELYLRPTSYFDAIVEEDRERAKLDIRKHLLTGNTIEYRIMRPDGAIRWIWSHWTPIFSADNKPERLCGIVHDISERKEVEKRVNEFYSTVSHELRTPLTSIRASLGLLEGGLAGDLSEKAVKLVSIARMESDRLIRLINDILDIRKIEAGKMELKLQRTRPRKLIDATISSIQGIADEAGVKLTADVQTDAVLNCDSDRMIQVITNLVSNAIKFSPRGSEISVKVRNTIDMCRFSVIDNGPGISADQMPKLFGLFQQLDSSDSRPKGGTGLGLAICKAIVEQHGGKVGVNSNVGVGSTFYFDLPLHERKEAMTLTGIKPFLLERIVLLIQDDPFLTQAMQELLAKENYSVIQATTIVQANEWIARLLPKAIVLDLTLSEDDGLEWIRKLRLEKRTRHVPVIVVGDRKADADTHANPNADTNADTNANPLLIDWLPKPMDENRLLQAVKVAVQETRLQMAKVLIVEDDVATRQILCHQLAEFGIRAIEAADGEQAMDMLGAMTPDLIILDVGVPPPDGFALIELLQQTSAKSIPLLVYTSLDLTQDDMRRLKLGSTRHLIKSRTSESELLAAVRELLTD
jgi:PAS domain S-box-containing protein